MNRLIFYFAVSLLLVDFYCLASVCPDAIEISDGSYSYTTEGLSNVYSNASCTPTTKVIWYKFWVTKNSNVSFMITSYNGGDADTTLDVFNQDCSTRITCNDDYPGSGVLSGVNFTPTQLSSYSEQYIYFMVGDRYQQSGGNGTFTVRSSSGISSTVVSDGIYFGSNYNISNAYNTKGCAPMTRTLWYRYLVPTGIQIVNFTVLSYTGDDTIMAVFSPNLTYRILCNDDIDENNALSRISLTPYYISEYVGKYIYFMLGDYYQENQGGDFSFSIETRGSFATTKPLTTSPLTTKALTTSLLTTKSLTTSPLTTQSPTTRPLTTADMTTEPLTTRSLSTSQLSTQSLTTEKLKITSSEITSSKITSNQLSTSKLTTNQDDIGSITTNELTTDFTNDENSDECIDSSDCEDQGVCLNGYCSCYSGFGGFTCQDKPQSACTVEYTELNSYDAKFEPEIGVSFENSIVKMIIKAPLESTMYENPSSSDHSLVASDQVYSLDTTITFVGTSSNSSEGECNYPKGLIENEYSWNKPYATFETEDEDRYCSDIYEFNLPWTLFQSRCDVETVSSNIFEQTIEISRNYAVPFGSDFITRTETFRKNIEFSFPDSVDISTDVGILSPTTVSISAILSVKYNIQSGRWAITIITDTIHPFKLIQASFNSDSDIDSRLQSFILVPTQPASTRQNLVIEIDSCEPINSVFNITLTSICYYPAECTESDEILSTMIATVKTGNACPLVHTIALSTSSLSSFSDSTFTQSKSIFFTNSIAYFRANIDSNEATITVKQLESVCISLNSGTCNNVSFNTITTQSDNPSFSISLSSLNGLAQDGDIVTVKVQVNIEWQSSTKRSIQTFDVAMNSQFIIKDQDSNTNDMIVPVNSACTSNYSIVLVLILIKNLIA